MSSGDILFDLIYSLTPSEKRYIRLFTSRHLLDRKSHALRIFDAIIGMKKYDEKVFKSRIGDLRNGRYLASEKTYLYRTILLGMRVFHAERSVDSQINELLIDAEFLFDKRLYNQSFELLSNAKKLAEEFERRPAMLEILQMEADIYKEKQTSDLKELIDLNHQIQRNVLGFVDDEFRLRMERDKALINIRFNFFKRTENEFSEENDYAFSGEEELSGKSFNHRHFLLSTNALVLVHNSRLKEASRLYLKLIDLWDENPHRKNAERMIYKRMLSNSINVFQLLSENTIADALIRKLKKVPCFNSEEEAEQFQVTAYAELLLLMNKGDWDNLEPLVREIESGLKHFKSKINRARELAFRFNISVCWLMLENWSLSLQWLNEIINTDKSDHRKDLQSLARILRLVVYYELHKHDLLEYELINVERYLRSRKIWFVYEATVLKFFKKLLDGNKENENQLFEKFLVKITDLNKGKNSVDIAGSTELKIWAKYHATGRSIRELLRAESVK